MHHLQLSDLTREADRHGWDSQPLGNEKPSKRYTSNHLGQERASESIGEIASLGIHSTIPNKKLAFAIKVRYISLLLNNTAQ